MTPEEVRQFNTYGCIARSLMMFAAQRGHVVTRDVFCQQFNHLFYDPATEYGGLFTSDIVEVVRAWGLGRYFLTFRRYAEIDGRANREKRGVLVASEINLNPGATNVIRHCSFLTGINAAGFSLLTPLQNGSDLPMTFAAADWDAKLCHGIVVI